MRAPGALWRVLATLIALTITPCVFAQASSGTAGTGSGAKPVSEADLPIFEPGQTTGAATGAQGAAGTGTGAAVAPASTVSLWDFGRMFLILAFVVALIYFIYWLLKKGTKRKVQENDLIRVLGSKSLVGSRALHLVEAAGGVYLIGSSDGGVELIAEVKDKEALDALRLRASQEVPNSGKRSFQDILSSVFKPAKKDSTPISESIALLKGQRDRLRKM